MGSERGTLEVPPNHSFPMVLYSSLADEGFQRQLSISLYKPVLCKAHVTEPWFLRPEDWASLALECVYVYVISSDFFCFVCFGKSLVDWRWGCFLLASSENNISVKEQSQKELQNNILTNKNSLSDKLVVCLHS